MRLRPDTYYHYYNRGNNRENIFTDETNYLHFLRLMRRYLPPVADVLSYCLLPNHFHLVIKTRTEEDLPEEYRVGRKQLWQPFSNLFNAYTKAYNKRYGRSGSLFQEHPKRIEISDEQYLRNVILYVNANPTHHGFGNYETYPHSSYNALISTGRTAIPRRSVIDLFDDLDCFIHAMANRSEEMAMELESE